MNKSKIEWCTHTWNPVTGCNHGCPYCYARDIAKRFKNAFPNGFKPTFHVERLGEPAKLKKPSHIFTVSMGDLFGDWVPVEWIEQTIGAMREADWHTYTILTKNPKRLSVLCNMKLPSNLIVGTSIAGADVVSLKRVETFIETTFGIGVWRLLSLEPFINPIRPSTLLLAGGGGLDWLIIGGQTGRNTIIPDQELVGDLVKWAHNRSLPIFVKDNCGYPERVQEYPAGVPPTQPSKEEAHHD